MRLAKTLTQRLRRWVEGRIGARNPDFVIGPPGEPYLIRWWLIPRNPLCNIYAHLILRSDDDRALHDHPWGFISIILRGNYAEWRTDKLGEYRWHYIAGDVLLRSPRTLHRIAIDPQRSALSLVITGPRIRQWGFQTKDGWVHWQQYLDQSNPGLPAKK